MKNMIVFGMSPDEFEEMVRKVINEERLEPLISKSKKATSAVDEATLNIKQASEFLNIPVGDIRKLIKRQEHPIPFMQPGKSLLFRKSKLIAWQEEEEQIAREKVTIKHNLTAELDDYLVSRRSKRRG